jgi:hypothetical protein
VVAQAGAGRTGLSRSGSRSLLGAWLGGRAFCVGYGNILKLWWQTQGSVTAQKPLKVHFKMVRK